MDTSPTPKTVNQKRAAPVSSASPTLSPSVSSVVDFKRSTETPPHTAACPSVAPSMSTKRDSSFLLRPRPPKLQSKDLAQITILHHLKPTKAVITTLFSEDQKDNPGSHLSWETIGSMSYMIHPRSLVNWITRIPLAATQTRDLFHLSGREDGHRNPSYHQVITGRRSH